MGSLGCGSRRLHEVCKIVDDHVSSMFAQRSGLADTIDADDQPEAPGPPGRYSRQGIFKYGGLWRS